MTPCVPLSLVGLLLLSRCSSSSSSSSSTLEVLTQRNSDFSARLYGAVCSRTDDNVFLSTVTLAAGLLALVSAANGPTRDQLLQGLSLTGLDPQSLPDLFQSLGTPVTNMKQGVAVFPAQGFPVSASYLDLVQTRFGGTAQSLAYTVPQEATDAINRWAQDRTGDEVQDLVTTLDPNTQLLLATTASYKAHFSPPFNVSFTQDERFYVGRYHIVMVPMMFRAGKYFLAYDDSVKVGVLKLPMASGTAMLVLLPDEGVDITAVEEQLTGEKIQNWIGRLKRTKLEVQLPRFLLERSYSLRDALQTLDITLVFQEDADLSTMGGATGLRLTQVHHKSVVSVDESGDDIIAEGGASPTSTPPPRLTVNRPFIFIIYQTGGVVLSMGRVIDPSRK
ncbi:protein Z-dependent protease inhibitor-like [Clinocottus analis]|uniref:protein Z-dependent protease inhibitor-like n=1 Tax=Clinocottus analis TaxID=304258 RepID=UPI0035BED526